MESVDGVEEHAIGVNLVVLRDVEVHAARLGDGVRRRLEGDLVNPRRKQRRSIDWRNWDRVGERLRSGGQRQAPDRGDDGQTGLHG